MTRRLSFEQEPNARIKKQREEDVKVGRPEGRGFNSGSETRLRRYDSSVYCDSQISVGPVQTTTSADRSRFGTGSRV